MQPSTKQTIAWNNSEWKWCCTPFSVKSKSTNDFSSERMRSSAETPSQLMLLMILYWQIWPHQLWLCCQRVQEFMPKWASNLINMYSEETQSLSDVTLMVEESLAGSTAGIKMVQSVFSVNYRNTHSVLSLSLTQVNTPVMEQREEDHEHQTSVMQLHWQYQVSLINASRFFICHIHDYIESI